MTRTSDATSFSWVGEAQVDGDGEGAGAPGDELAVVAGLVLVEHQGAGAVVLVGVDHHARVASYVTSPMRTRTAGSTCTLRTQSDRSPAPARRYSVSSWRAYQISISWSFPVTRPRVVR